MRKTDNIHCDRPGRENSGPGNSGPGNSEWGHFGRKNRQSAPHDTATDSGTVSISPTGSGRAKSRRHPCLYRKLRSCLSAVFVFVYVAPAYAAGSGMPWEAPLQRILQSVQGPVAKIIAVIIIIVTGLTLAFGESAGGFRRLIQIVFGLSIAFAASSFFLSFFSFGGGALVW
ncbi:TrbC/VirB2 family protein [Ruegeria sp.]|uniref:TrbC/VirB2 family protein n=1 Tax=Ruegeria sp. TaxID=1879320 RepID=UPI003B00BFA2